MLLHARLEQEARLREPAHDLIRGLGRREAVQPSVRVVEATRLVDGGEHGEVVDTAELEVLLPRSGSDVDDAGPLLERDLVPRDHAVLDVRCGRQVVERPAVAEADELRSRGGLDERLVGVARGRNPLAVLAPPVLGVGLDRRRDVRGQRPRRRRPDDERLALPVEEREPDVERRVAAILVDAALRQLVLRDGRAATRAPLRGAMALVEHPALPHALEEAPDVLDVRVGEREVVVPPVHPLAEPLRPARELRRRPDDLLAAAPCELGEAVVLDVPLRVEPELALDAHLDPQALAVEPVLIALVEAAERLVALEDVLQRAPPRGVHRERLVGGDGAVDEAEGRAATVLLAQLLERPLALPALEDRELERVVIGLVREGCEDLRHAVSV